MKLIQIHPHSSFLTWPQMSIAIAGNQILFGFVANSIPLAQFDCHNDIVAQEVYKFLVECLQDPETQGADLVYFNDRYAKYWIDAPTIGSLLEELAEKEKQDLGNKEWQPYWNSIREAVSPYVDANRKPHAGGKMLLKFCEMQKDKAV